MPPRKGIVKTGNAGNSSKNASTQPSAQTENTQKALFPPGYKYPLSLLNERCQKEGWEKPIVDTPRKGPDGFGFSVTLSRIDKKTSQRESVRLAPTSAQSQVVLPTALEARHWGAVYAMYRFCNNIQLNRVLPPGAIRDYWNQLAAEHKAAPEHQQWMYRQDPFAARKEVEERQAKAAEARAEQSNGKTQASSSRSGPVSSEFSHAPEVRMATNLREVVEQAIKKAFTMYPEATDAAPSTLISEDTPKVTQQLSGLGFSAMQVKQAVQFLTRPSPLASSLLANLSSTEAAIEFLVLHLPESDLPRRFLPANNSSNPFVSSTHSGTEDLKKRWIEDKAVKEAGWPAHVVRECTSDSRLISDWTLLLAALNHKLVGASLEVLFDESASLRNAYEISSDELLAIGGSQVNESHFVLPLFSHPVELHILVPQTPLGLIPTYITSNVLPAYIRLHLVSLLIVAQQDNSIIEDGNSFVMGAMQLLEAELDRIEKEGRPDVSDVLRHILPHREAPSSENLAEDEVLHTTASQRISKLSTRQDTRNNSQVKSDFMEVCNDKKYDEIVAARQKLPAFRAKKDFLSLLKSHRVVVVVGETGCGKTTQLPQYVLDSLIEDNQGAQANIIITQPRRLSAMGVASRVSAERLEDGSVGYSIRGETRRTPKTKLLFCTTGIVLRRLSAGDGLRGVTHVVVDEVHERSIDGDFLLLQLKELLRRAPNLKVVLMSATINHETFIKYFNDAPLLTIPGFTHPVTDVFLEEIIPEIGYVPRMVTQSKGKEKEMEKLRAKYPALDAQHISALHSTISSGQVDYQLIGAIVKHLTNQSKTIGSILIFLSGVQEIRQCIEAVKTALGSGSKAKILPLHANLSSDEQRRIFDRSSQWKIIASTNVAETSITIDDVLYVIDTGKVKETNYDAASGLVRLEESWITKAAGRQRRGRAGRTQSGVCYKLYTRDLESKMAPFPTPEILRVPLENISLSVKVLREHDDVKAFLRQSISPPDVSALDKAWLILKEIGAIDTKENLTALGRYIAMLPVDLRLAKMLVYGCLFKCLNPVLTIAAILSCKPLFLSPPEKREEANQARARFLTSNSDVLTDLAAYDECVKLQSESKSQATIKMFCQENFISPTSIREINTLRSEFLSNLMSIGLIPQGSTAITPQLNKNNHHINLIKSVLLAGLWPRLATVKLPKDAIKFDKVQAGTIQRENQAKEFKIFDLKDGRVFLHPGSSLFANASWKTPFIVYFNKHQTSKIFLRDATEVPYYALLLFGGQVSVNHVGGGVTVGEGDSFVKLKAWPRIGILVNHLRRLLDAQLMRSINEGTPLTKDANDPVLHAMLLLLANDGLSE